MRPTSQFPTLSRSHSALHAPQVLIVDDHALTGHMLCGMVQACLQPDAGVRTAGCLAEGIASLHANLRAGHEPGVVLLDLFLPDARGSETLSRWRRAFPGIPVAVMADAPDAVLTARCLEMGAHAMLNKAQDLAGWQTALNDLLLQTFGAQSLRLNHAATTPEATTPSLYDRAVRPGSGPDGQDPSLPARDIAHASAHDPFGLCASRPHAMSSAPGASAVLIRMSSEARTTGRPGNAQAAFPHPSQSIRAGAVPGWRHMQGIGDAPRASLSPRQLEVLELLVEGASNKVICRELGLALSTVKCHVSGILMALQAPSRARAVATAIRQGLVRPEQRAGNAPTAR